MKNLVGMPSRTTDEAGISLVEVIMYSALSALLLSVLGGLFYAGFTTQASAAGRNAATGSAVVASNSLQTAVRNASSISVTGTVLKARVATGASGWQCVAWALTVDNKLVYKTSSVAITSSTDYSGWATLATGVLGRLESGDAFIGDSTKVSYSLAFATGGITDPNPVPVAGAVTASALGPGSPESCW